MKYTIQDLERDLFRRNGKYTVMGVAIAIIHFIYILLFYRIGYIPMVIYNIICVSLYLYLGIKSSQEGTNYHNFYVYLCIEIPLHAVLCTLILGWDYKFMLFMFGMIPIAFYIIVFIDGVKHSILVPTILSLFYVLLYLIVKYMGEHINPILMTEEVAKYEYFFMYFNTVITFIMILAFSIVFSFEYNYIHNKLTSENNRLGNYASYDTLTGLLNRRSIDAHLDRTYKNHYREEESFSVIMCDIDHFKNVNDTYGHEAGDYVLKEVASVISKEVRDNDVVGRWGGEEFFIILNTNKDSAVKLAERVRTAIESHTFTYKAATLHITMTFGVSAYRSGTDIGSLVRSADKKLYRGKESGRNQVVS